MYPRYHYCTCACCRSGTEKQVVELLSTDTTIKALSPIKYKREKHHGRWETITKRLFPGYVFIFGLTEETVVGACRNADLRMLRYSDGTWQLRGDDMSFAEWILTEDGVIGISRVSSNGDSITIIDGPLSHLRGSIVRIDKRRRLAKVKFEMSDLQVWLSFDWVDAE